MNLPWWGWLGLAFWCLPALHIFFAMLRMNSLPRYDIPDEEEKIRIPRSRGRDAFWVSVGLLLLLLLWPLLVWQEWHLSTGKEAVDDDTLSRYYDSNTSIPRAIPIRLRKVLVEQLGRRWHWVKPDDWLIESDEIDFDELLDDIGDEFGISIPDDDKQQLEPTFDSVVRYLAGRLMQQRA